MFLAIMHNDTGARRSCTASSVHFRFYFSHHFWLPGTIRVSLVRLRLRHTTAYNSMLLKNRNVCSVCVCERCGLCGWNIFYGFHCEHWTGVAVVRTRPYNNGNTKFPLRRQKANSSHTVQKGNERWKGSPNGSPCVCVCVNGSLLWVRYTRRNDFLSESFNILLEMRARIRIRFFPPLLSMDLNRSAIVLHWNKIDWPRRVSVSSTETDTRHECPPTYNKHIEWMRITLLVTHRTE